MKGPFPEVSPAVFQEVEMSKVAQKPAHGHEKSDALHGKAFAEATRNEADRKKNQELLARQKKLRKFIHDKIEGRVETDHLRDRSAAIAKWRQVHGSGPLPPELMKLENFRETQLDKIYCWYKASQKGDPKAILNEVKLAEYEKTARKFVDLADRMESFVTHAGRGGLNKHIPLEERLKNGGPLSEKGKADLAAEHLMNEASISDETFENYRKRRLTFSLKGLQYDVYLRRFRRMMEQNSYGPSPIPAERFLKICSAKGIDPILAASQAIAESHFGTDGLAISTHNIFNVGNTDDGTANPMGQWERGMMAYCDLMKDAYGDNLDDCVKRDFRRVDSGARYASGPSYTRDVAQIGREVEQTLFEG